MYAILKEYKHHGNIRFKKWRDRSKTGPKPLLQKHSIDDLVDEYHKSTEGDCASSRVELESSIKDKIIEELDTLPGIHVKKDHVPSTSMQRTVDKVMALHKFNIMDTVSNKTESRSAAEFSIRSTISYMMVVLSAHFINAPPSEFHTKHKDIQKTSVYKLLEQLNKEAMGYCMPDDQLIHLTYVLPNLITSTDESSLFITNKVINNIVSWYFMARPSSESSPNIDSNRRDCYTTNLTGDAHLRGLRISLNNTFTAGGRCAPIFATIGGLKANEMPRDEIVICRVKGLVAASSMTGSMQEGFIVFVRGKYEVVSEEQTNQIDDTDMANDDTTDMSLSKESRVAKIYREEVFYPFIHQIRTNDYQLSSVTEEIPDNLTAVSWMDGCHGQLKLTTTESVMKKEKKLKIVTCKHSAARTAVEQAADVGLMFKMVKSAVKKMLAANYENSPLFF